MDKKKGEKKTIQKSIMAREQGETMERDREIE